MKAVIASLLLIILTVSALAMGNAHDENERSLQMNFSGVIKDETGKISAAKLLGGLVLSLLLVSEVFLIIRRKKTK